MSRTFALAALLAAAFVSAADEPNRPVALADAAAGRVELVIEYEVPEAYGKRFGVVTGKFGTTAAAAK